MKVVTFAVCMEPDSCQTAGSARLALVKLLIRGFLVRICQEMVYSRSAGTGPREWPLPLASNSIEVSSITTRFPRVGRRTGEHSGSFQISRPSLGKIHDGLGEA